MTKSIRIGISLLALVIGCSMIGFGYTTTIGHPTTTILFLLGLGLSIAGLIAAVLYASQ